MIAFDDSFEHEVYNGCNRDRLVLQLVIMHPGVVSENQNVAIAPV